MLTPTARRNNGILTEKASDLPVTQPLDDSEDILIPFAPKEDNWGFLSAQQNYYETREIFNHSFR